MSLHPISSSHLHVRISRSRSTSLSVSILSHLQRALYTSHPCFSLSIPLPLISILVSPHRLHTVTSRTTPRLFQTIYKSLWCLFRGGVRFPHALHCCVACAGDGAGGHCDGGGHPDGAHVVGVGRARHEHTDVFLCLLMHPSIHASIHLY